jgi:DtxR family Mn-dependent transcriptional regulator
MPERDWNEEELLEAIWTAEEKQDPTRGRVEHLAHVPVHDCILDRMQHDGLIRLEGERLVLTDDGRGKAREIIRRHRLAERLLHDVLSLKVEDAESSACEFEHILAPQVTESICTLLGHPRECPHGTPIPEGKCCQEARRQVESLVVPLTKLKPGESGRVAYISTTHHPRLHKLISFGVAPGARIRCHQKYPSIIIQRENTELALEEDVAKDIYVWREP